MDLTDYEKSGSWDVYDVPGDIENTVDKKTGQNISRAIYTVKLRRKTLFYTVNLIVPSVLISILSMVSFYLPTTAGEKITMSLSILLALVVFLQASRGLNCARFFHRETHRFGWGKGGNVKSMHHVSVSVPALSSQLPQLFKTHFRAQSVHLTHLILSDSTSIHTFFKQLSVSDK